MNRDFRRLPSLDPLKGFEAAARHLSFTRAAEELFLTQSAVSRQIQTLEQQLGVRLFHRATRSLRLTPEGERLLRTVSEIFHRLADTVDLLHSAQRRLVTVSTAIGIASLWLIPRLAKFQELHPEVDVRVSANNRIADLEREGLDLALRYIAEEGAPAGARRMFGEAVFPVGSPAVVGHCARRPMTAADLGRFVLLSFDDFGRYPWLDWNTWLKALALDHASPKGILHFNHYDQMIHAAADSQGIALGRGPLVRKLLESGRLVALAGERRTVTSRAYFLVRSAGSERPEVDLLVDWMMQEAAATEAGERSQRRSTGK